MNAVTDQDKGMMGIAKRMLRLRGLVAVVGVFGAKGKVEVSGISMARLAAVHEFGATIKTPFGVVVVPERSFIRAWVDANMARIGRAIEKLIDQVIGGMQPEKALMLLGEFIANGVMGRIEDGIAPENAASTVARKGSSKPLIDSGAMKNSIAYDVREEHEAREALR